MEEQRSKSRSDMLAEEGERIRNLSDEALRQEYFRTGGAGVIADLLQQEVAFRTARPKHHWSLTPALCIACLTMIFAAIAAWPIVKDWLWPLEPKAFRNELAPVPQTIGTPAQPSAMPLSRHLPSSPRLHRDHNHQQRR